jgi:TolB protein
MILVITHRLTDGNPYATTPAFSADGEVIYFVELDPRRQFRLMRIPTYGGAPEPVEVVRWDYGAGPSPPGSSVPPTRCWAIRT